MKVKKIVICAVLALLLLAAVMFFIVFQLLGTARAHGNNGEVTAEELKLPRFVFNADSAYSYCVKQCSFGPRVMNSVSHDECGEWIKQEFVRYGLVITSQKMGLKGYDGTVLHCENIIARFNPAVKRRLIVCAHWDSRPWADNDPNQDNHRTPVMAANDGASGVAVMLELARMICKDSLSVGIDFICFDAEDYGVPQWADYNGDTDETWAHGAQYWSEKCSSAGENDGSEYEYGVLLDMVGGEGARFYKERMSEEYAPQVVERVWQAAHNAGYASFFPSSKGTFVTDDHIPVNETAGIPCIDIIPYYPDCISSSFGPTWHTVDDTMEHISVSTLKAVGQTLAELFAGY